LWGYPKTKKNSERERKEETGGEKGGKCKATGGGSKGYIIHNLPMLGSPLGGTKRKLGGDRKMGKGEKRNLGRGWKGAGPYVRRNPVNSRERGKPIVIRR